MKRVLSTTFSSRYQLPYTSDPKYVGALEALSRHKLGMDILPVADMLQPDVFDDIRLYKTCTKVGKPIELTEDELVLFSEKRSSISVALPVGTKWQLLAYITSAVNDDDLLAAFFSKFRSWTNPLEFFHILVIRLIWVYQNASSRRDVLSKVFIVMRYWLSHRFEEDFTTDLKLWFVSLCTTLLEEPILAKSVNYFHVHSILHFIDCDGHDEGLPRDSLIDMGIYIPPYNESQNYFFSSSSTAFSVIHGHKPVTFSQYFEMGLPRHILMRKRLSLVKRKLFRTMGQCSDDIVGYLDENGNRNTFLALNSRSTSDLAIGITLLEHEIMSSIPGSEFEDLKWTASDASTKAPYLSNYILHFNELSSWTTTQVLSHSTFKGQKRAYQKLVRVAFKCYVMKNYSSAAAITAGLENYRIDILCKRLYGQKCLAEKLDHYEKSILKMLRSILNPASNFKQMRGNLNREVEERKPHLPILLIYLNDLYNTAESSRVRHCSLPDYMFPFDLMRQEAIVKRKYDQIVSYKIPETNEHDSDLINLLELECKHAATWMNKTRENAESNNPKTDDIDDPRIIKDHHHHRHQDKQDQIFDKPKQDSIQKKKRDVSSYSLSALESNDSNRSLFDLKSQPQVTNLVIPSWLTIGVHKQRNQINITSRWNSLKKSNHKIAEHPSPTSQYYKLYRMNDPRSLEGASAGPNSIHFSFHRKLD